MTRTERAFRDGARFLMEQGVSKEGVIQVYAKHAAEADAKGRHDEARELRAAMEEFREVENGKLV